MGREIDVPVRQADRIGTRLSRWHPYPAMVPDDLAVAIAAMTVRPGARVLDPFCGSGRLLMAASALGADCIGLDVNPLARLITEAKAATPRMGIIADVAREAIVAARVRRTVPALSLQHTKVAWLSEGIAIELAQIVHWINSLCLGSDELLVVATALSAATRDVAWISKSGWKLHRIKEADRLLRQPSAWGSFSARLARYLNDATTNPLSGSVEVRLQRVEDLDPNMPSFDAILTSPPYGDSKTTVQYGAASSLCLDVVTRLDGLEDRYLRGSIIDHNCLGGGSARRNASGSRRYWAGAAGSEGARRVFGFLDDFASNCRALADRLAPGGTIVMIVGRRSVSGFRVKLDEFAIDQMVELGLTICGVERRHLQQKNLPRVINRFARANSEEQRASGRTKTMDEEIIITSRSAAVHS